ncbi:MAG: FG-GAP-like repeat-containing protein [Verrucomicrobiales bacterium]
MRRLDQIRSVRPPTRENVGLIPRYARRLALAAVAGSMACGATVFPAAASLLSHLEDFGRHQSRIGVGHPELVAADGEEGPKTISHADLNGDGEADLVVGNLDGTVTVLIARGGGAFSAPQHLLPLTGELEQLRELRGVLAVDLNGDAKPDIATASPQDGQMAVFFNTGEGRFEAPVPLPGWIGVRSLAAGDFDGDGIVDLAAAGPGAGVRHFRGTGGGDFQVMGDLPRLSPKNINLERPRPVYAMRTIRSRDGARDELLVTHADSTALWILSTQLPDRSQEQPILTRVPAWTPEMAPVVMNEIQIQNTGSLLDEDGTAQPWVELLNRSNKPVEMSDWKLEVESSTWRFPAVTIPPGRFLTVFLSGKNRSVGPALHTSFLIKENTGAISLHRPGFALPQTINLPPHSVTGVSRGLAPDNGSVKWFDIPSPGAENNAGLSHLDNLSRQVSTTVSITPDSPAPSQPVRVRVTSPAKPTGSSSLKVVWLAVTLETVENYYPLRPATPGTYEGELPAGAFAAGAPYRVLARVRDDPPSTNDYTVELYRSASVTGGGGPAESQSGALQPVASVPCDKAKSLEIGPILRSTNSSETTLDLVYTSDATGRLHVLRAAPNARRFAPVAVQDFFVAGVPRDVKLGDFDADGWLDALVVLREKNVAVICRNEAGRLGNPSGELQTGASPREATVVDLNGDDLPDAAVINRHSGDVSILLSRPTASGLVTSDQIYPVDGDVAALEVRDFNGDGRADVLQLHRASSELSVQIAGPDGRLSPPRYFPIGSPNPTALALADLNNDKIMDVVTANLGVEHRGSVSILHGLRDGGFGPPRLIDAEASLFAIAVADFNNDGIPDLVTGLWDCRAKFFYGTSAGDFIASPELPVPFVNESRVLVTGDFDGDGDIDIAGAGIESDMATLENNLNPVIPGPRWIRRYYPRLEDRTYGAYRIGITYLDEDDDDEDDADLLIGSGYGVILFRGLPGMGFERVPADQAGHASAGLPYAISDVFSANIVGDSKPDLIAACEAAACLDILSQEGEGLFVRSDQVRVPSSKFLATGDLDGDGEPDLVGSGDVLWTVLSGEPPRLTPPATPPSTRPRLGGIVINEILPRNTAISVPADNRRNSDFVELFNGGPPINVSGWKLRLEAVQNGEVIDRTWTLPTVALGSQARLVIVFAEPLAPALPSGTAPRTGFTLPVEGGTLTLLRPDNRVRDRVAFPRMQADVSWSRFLDGHPNFRASAVPTPGFANTDNGSPPPDVELIAPPAAALRAEHPIVWSARGRDDAGIISISLIYNRLVDPWPEPRRINLYDNGEGADSPTAMDGLFHGRMDPLDHGTQIQFYLEAIDIGGETIRMPDVEGLSAVENRPTGWTFAIDIPPALAIVEVCSHNDNLRRDEQGENSDYVIIRNTGPTSVDLSPVVLAQSPFSDNSGLYSFPPGLSLAPGSEVTVFTDGTPSVGPMHAPFNLSADGEELSLFALRPSGARQWIDSLNVPPMQADERVMQLPGTSLRAVVSPGQSLDAWAGQAWDKTNQAVVAIRFFAEVGKPYQIEGLLAGDARQWVAVNSLIGDGTVRTITRSDIPVANAELVALRCLRRDQFRVSVDAALPGYDANIQKPIAGLFGTVSGTVAGDFDVTVLISEHSDLSNPMLLSVPVAGSQFEAQAILERGKDRHYFRALVPGPGGGVWSAPGTSVSAPSSLAGVINQGPVTYSASSQIGTMGVNLSATMIAPPPSDARVSFVIGPKDEFSNADAWLITANARGSGPLLWTAFLTELDHRTEYVARAAIIHDDWVVVSPQRVRFRPPPPNNGLPGQLHISEIMYNPPLPTVSELALGYDRDDFEFIELHNPSDAPVDLAGMWFEGIDLDFPASGAPVIPPDGNAVIAANPYAFAMRYGSYIPLAGWTLHPFRRSRLDNGGEVLRLINAGGTSVLTAGYTDQIDSTDGAGRSLQWSPSDRVFIRSEYWGGNPGRGYLIYYSEWIAKFFTPDQAQPGGIAGLKADPDEDGADNLSEYVFGSHPLQPGVAGQLHIAQIIGPTGAPQIEFSFEVDPSAADYEVVLESAETPGAQGFRWKRLESVISNALYNNLRNGIRSEVRRVNQRPRVIVTFTLPAFPGNIPSSQYFRLRINSD